MNGCGVELVATHSLSLTVSHIFSYKPNASKPRRNFLFPLEILLTRSQNNNKKKNGTLKRNGYNIFSYV